MRNNKAITILIALLAIGAGGWIGCQKEPVSPGTAATQATRYHCPMHPHYTSDKPGDCPICGMKLVPIENATSHTTAVPGQAMVQLSTESEQRIGVRVSSAQVRDVYNVVRASARVAYDPGLYSAILEHQEAVRALNSRTAASSFYNEATETVRASKLRLRQMGLSDTQIEQVSRDGFDPANLLLGQNGNKVWVYVELFDYEATSVRPGQRVELTSPSFPGRTFTGTVRSVDSVVNSETRTLRARVDVPNPDNALKPEMYLNAKIFASGRRQLVIQESAVMDTGTRQLVFVQKEPGHYEPRQVRLGQQSDGYFEILEGLREGEAVAVSATFLLDSESKLRAATQGASQ